MTNQDFTLLVGSLGVLVSAVAVTVSAATARRQATLTKSLSEAQAALTERIHASQTKLSQRQLFLDIWPRLESLNAIDPKQPIAVDVVRAVNVLELVALCWEGDMVDADVIRRAFGERYLHFYEIINQVPNLGNPNKNGFELILENPAIGRLRDQLRKEVQERGAPLPLAVTK